MIGVCSYLLIGYYSHRLSAIKSAQQAILVNRISDGMLLWGILWIWYYTGTLEYDLINLATTPYVSTFLGFAILIGAMGKSAQILFHVWLPNAMEGGLVQQLLNVLYNVLCVFFCCYCSLVAVKQSCLESTTLLCVVVTSNKRRKVSITKYQQEMICGLLLGDCSLSDPNNRGKVDASGSYRLEFTFKGSVLEYVRWLKFEILANVCTSTEPSPWPKDMPTQYTFSSSQFPYFTQLAVMWYLPHPKPTLRLKVKKI